MVFLSIYIYTDFERCWERPISISNITFNTEEEDFDSAVFSSVPATKARVGQC